MPTKLLAYVWKYLATRIPLHVLWLFLKHIHRATFVVAQETSPLLLLKLCQ